MALLFALGIPDSVDGKAFFLVVAYSGVVVFAIVGHLLGGSFDEARQLSMTDNGSPSTWRALDHATSGR